MKLKLKIEGMGCGGCARGIKKTLEMKKLVKSVNVDFDSKISEIEFDEGQVNKEEIIGAISEMGYEVEEIKK